MGYFRDSPRGSQNLVPRAAGAFVLGPVFDDSLMVPIQAPVAVRRLGLWLGRVGGRDRVGGP